MVKRNFNGGGWREAMTSNAAYGSTSVSTSGSRSNIPDRGRGQSNQGNQINQSNRPLPNVNRPSNPLPNRNTPYDANEFASISPSMQAANEQRARDQEKKDRVQAQMLQNTLDRAQREREAKGNVYKPNLSPKGSAIGSGDAMAASFFGTDKPGALHAWTDESGKGHTGTLDEMAAARGWTGEGTGKVPGFGQASDIDKYLYSMYDYGDFGYGPGSQWDKELIQFFGGKPKEGFSHAQLTEYLYGIGAAGIDDSMFLGGKPGQIGFGPGEKPDWYGKPRTGTTGGGGGAGGRSGWGSGGGGGGGGGGGYGPPPGYKAEQMAGFYTPQANLQQAMINVHKTPTVFKKRGGIVSLLELR